MKWFNRITFVIFGACCLLFAAWIGFQYGKMRSTTILTGQTPTMLAQKDTEAIHDNQSVGYELEAGTPKEGEQAMRLIIPKATETVDDSSEDGVVKMALRPGETKKAVFGKSGGAAPVVNVSLNWIDVGANGAPLGAHLLVSGGNIYSVYLDSEDREKVPVNRDRIGEGLDIWMTTSTRDRVEISMTMPSAFGDGGE